MKSCGRKSNFGLCTDDDWTFKCPSGCRLQGIMSSMEEKSERKLRKTCQRAQVLEDAHEESVTTSHLLYNSIHLTLDNRHDSELKFFGLSGSLSQNLTRLRKKSVQLEQRLEKLRGRAKEQIEKLYRMEVDIDMKLRACSGSCRSCGSFSVDHNSFQSLVENLDTVTVSDISTPHNDVPHLTLQPTVNAQLWSSVQTQLLSQFKDIVLDQFVLSVQSGEEEMINNDDLE